MVHVICTEKRSLYTCWRSVFNKRSFGPGVGRIINNGMSPKIILDKIILDKNF